MRKFVFVLTFVCAMLLMCSCASAEICDIHSNVTYESKGYMTHTWVCNDCGLSGERDHTWGPWIDLGKEHVRECVDCGGRSNASDHYYYCYRGDGSTCEGCGLTGISSENMELEHWNGYINLGDQHIYGCTKCGVAEEWAQPSAHHTWCHLDTTVCNGCRATGLAPEIIKIYHTEGGRPKDLGTQHQLTCKYCDYEYEPAYHYGSCQFPTVCKGCDAPGVNILPEHLSHRYEVVDLGKQHVWVCKDCLEYREEPENHHKMCDEDMCWICDLPVDNENAELSHWTSYTTYERTTTEHTAICSSCDKHWEPIKHFRICTESGICAECRMSSYSGVVISRTVHYAKEGTITYNAEGHSFDCLDCGQRVKNQPHFYWYSDECDECGYLYGSMEPSPIAKGDASGDGTIDILDALAVLQAAVGWNNTIYDEAADVNGDGACDILDALLILQYAVGWDVEFV